MHLGSAVAGAHKTTPIHQRKRNCTKRNDENKRERDKMGTSHWEALIEDMLIGNYHQPKILPASVKTNPLRGLQISLHKCPNLILTIF